MDQPKQQLLEKTLRRLHAGFKTFQLYPPSHASAHLTVQDVTANLRGYLQRYGGVALQVTKDRLLVDAMALSDSGMTALAFYLYVRNLTSLTILPGVSDTEVAAFLRIVSQDRQALESSGGVEQLIASQDLPHITVKAILLRESVDELSEAGIIDALTRVRRLSPDQREAVFAMLRQGPSATAGLLTSVQRATGIAPSQGEALDVEPLLIALETLDRAVLDEPVEEQEALMQSLAQSLLHLDDRVRAALAPELLSQAVEGGSGRAILSELTGQEVVLLMLGPAGQGELTPRLGRFLADLSLPEEKAARVTTFLQTAMTAASNKMESFVTSLAGPPPRPEHTEKNIWGDVEAALITFGRQEEAALPSLRAETAEAAVMRDTIKGLINLIKLQERPEEIADTAKMLATRVEFMADHQEFDLLILALQLIQEARTLAEAQRPAIDSELARVLTASVLDRLVHHALQSRADAPDAVRQGLVALREQVVPHLVRLLDHEPSPTERTRLCKLLTEVCSGHADLIGAYLPRVSLQVARNLAFVLGELHDPAAVAHLARLASHPEYQVRQEAIDALRKIHLAQARAGLSEFFQDRDPRIQLALIESADSQYDSRMVDWMQRVIRSSDWTPSAISVKVAAIKALARMKAEDALPLLRRVARARWVFGLGRRTVRDAARQIVDTWERSPQRPA